jgi:hypothetical protein
MILSRSYVQGMNPRNIGEAREKRELVKLLERTESLVKMGDGLAVKIEALDNSSIDLTPDTDRVLYERRAEPGDSKNLWELSVWGSETGYRETVDADLTDGQREITASFAIPGHSKQNFIIRDQPTSGLVEYRGKIDGKTSAKVTKREIPGREPTYEVFEGGLRIFMHDTFGL